METDFLVGHFDLKCRRCKSKTILMTVYPKEMVTTCQKCGNRFILYLEGYEVGERDFKEKVREAIEETYIDTKPYQNYPDAYMQGIMDGMILISQKLKIEINKKKLGLDDDAQTPQEKPFTTGRRKEIEESGVSEVPKVIINNTANTHTAEKTSEGETIFLKKSPSDVCARCEKFEEKKKSPRDEECERIFIEKMKGIVDGFIFEEEEEKGK